MEHSTSVNLCIQPNGIQKKKYTTPLDCKTSKLKTIIILLDYWSLSHKLLYTTDLKQFFYLREPVFN